MALIVFRFIVLISTMLLVSCKNTDNEKLYEPVPQKTDLYKAAMYNMQLGLGYLNQGNRARAKQKLITALDEAPKSPQVNAAIAYYFEQTQELEKAKKYYIKAMNLSGNGGAELNNYGAFLCRLGDYKKAEAYFLKAINDVHYVHTAGAYENAGLCALAVPDYGKAKSYFTAALNQDPSRRDSLYELVKLEHKLGNDKQALQLVRKYPNLILSDRNLLDLAANIANQQGAAI